MSAHKKRSETPTMLFTHKRRKVDFDDGSGSDSESESSTLFTQKRRKVRFDDEENTSESDSELTLLTQKRRKVVFDDEEDSDDESDSTLSTYKQKLVFDDIGNNSDSGIDPEIDPNNCSITKIVDVPLQAESGIVEKVSLTNFMCHSRLEVSFGANVNFIIGRNGSGKSAILTGLIVGLGGNASHTSRGNSLKGFVKTGCSCATVVVTLKNRGTDAYKPDEYGHSITVERKIASSGSSSYKLIGDGGEIVSTRKRDLVEILDRFNIQIDSPVSILTQDVSRTFLHSSNAKDKYTFFIKASHLERLSADYQNAINEEANTTHVLETKKKMLEELSEEVEVRESEFKHMQQLQRIEGDIDDLRKEHVWAKVAEKKAEVAKLKDKEDSYERKLVEYTEALEKLSNEEKERQAHYQLKANEFKDFSEGVQGLLEEKREFHEAYKVNRKKAQQVQEQIRRMERDINVLQKDKACLTSKINEINDSTQRDLEAEKERREKETQEKMALREEYEIELATCNHHLQKIETDVKKKLEEKYTLQNEIKNKKSQIDNMKKRIASLKSNRRDALAKFGKQTAAILKSIEVAHMQKKFHRKPIGPLGVHVKVREFRWAKAVEECVKSKLCSYLCHDEHDMLLLKEIFRAKCGANKMPGIVLSRFHDRPYDVARMRPTGYSPITTVLDMLVIDDFLVANALVDQCSVDTTLLFENAREAQKVMWDVQPRGAFMSFSIEGHKIIGGRSSKYYACKEKHIQFFERDVANSIRESEEEMQSTSDVEKDLQKRLHALETDIQALRNDAKDAKQKCSSKHGLIQRVLLEIKELEQFEQHKVPDVETLEEEVREIDDKNVQLSADLNELKVSLVSERSNVEAARVRVNECDEKCSSTGDALESYKEQLTALEGQIGKLIEFKKHYDGKITEHKKSIASVCAAYQAVLAEHDEIRLGALEICAELVPTKSVKTLGVEISKLEKCLGSAGLERMDEVTIAYYRIKKRYDEIVKEIENCTQLREDFRKSVRRRAKKFKSLRIKIMEKCKGYFQNFLSQRGYEGDLIFDTVNETLDIHVNVEGSGGCITEDSSSLSGGERSFSTVCFVMALWDSMEPPFRCLDEFDVFMDLMNRKVALSLLLEAAESKKHRTRQFIFLTPFDISNVHANEKVKILRLDSPERDDS